MRPRFLSLLALAACAATGLLGAGCSQAASPATQVGYVTVGVTEAYKQLSIMNTGAQIVDVREPDEWAATGVALGAVLIPLGELEARAAAELAKDKPVYVICNSGNRSRTGSQILADLGYTQVYNVDGGIQAWLAAGYPVEYRP